MSREPKFYLTVMFYAFHVNLPFLQIRRFFYNFCFFFLEKWERMDEEKVSIPLYNIMYVARIYFMSYSECIIEVYIFLGCTCNCKCLLYTNMEMTTRDRKNACYYLHTYGHIIHICSYILIRYKKGITCGKSRE